MEFKEQYPQLFINDEEKITTTAMVKLKKNINNQRKHITACIRHMIQSTTRSSPKRQIQTNNSRLPANAHNGINLYTVSIKQTHKSNNN